MKRNQLIALALLVIGVWSCGNDDGGDGLLDAVFVEALLLSDVAVDNDVEIVAYLQSHFYNYEEFENPPADFDFKIRFDTIAGDNADKMAIFDRPELKSVVIEEASATFGREDGEVINHTLYYLEARVGVGESPTIGDNVVLQYEGTLLDGTPFDAINNPTSQYMSGGFIRGYTNGITRLRAGTGFMSNDDGTVDFEDYGIGAIFFPSGLGYFSNPPTASNLIDPYVPLIFKVDVLAFVADTDFDGDGIPSILEDLDGDGNLNNDNTDVDLEPNTVFLPNHNDTDDDQDGILTIDEIELDADGNFVGFLDTDGDGIFDHLDNDN